MRLRDLSRAVCVCLLTIGASKYHFWSYFSTHSPSVTSEIKYSRAVFNSEIIDQDDFCDKILYAMTANGRIRSLGRESSHLATELDKN